MVIDATGSYTMTMLTIATFAGITCALTYFIKAK
jgi:hypothetical protein